MKQFITQPRVLRENHHNQSSSSSSSTYYDTTSPNPNNLTKLRSTTTTPSRKQMMNCKENVTPDSSSTKCISVKATVDTMRSPMVSSTRPPNPRKRKLALDPVLENLVFGADSGVQVLVRTRPSKVEEGEMIVKKISSNSLTINGQTMTFDYVADQDATQLDIFELVGAPLVENCLAGFNSSVFAYGQTGSGKTYTMWGPTNILLDENLLSDQQGLTIRVFDKLLTRINEEQIKHADKHVKYQCRCSFLEIYNEQITDLLDPTQKNLQIREDVKSGVYVENLTEEYVSTMKDVTQLLIKGLSNRRTGATSINAASSRSHSVFTCIVESRCKSTEDGVSSVKTSRINLVDLAGSERQKLTGASGARLKEAGNINRSLSQLGNLINILAEISQTGKQRHIPYRDSRLTFLLQESLGGNAKLAMVCAISPSQSCKSETFSTLRFAHRAKAIKNKAVVNEVMQDDVKVLRGVIRDLKDELLRVKANGNSTDSNGGCTKVWNARRSLNILQFNMNSQMNFPLIDEDGDIEMEIVEEVLNKECAQWESEIMTSIGEPQPKPTGGETVIVEEVLKKECAQLESEIMTSIGEPQPKPTGGETVIVEEVLKKECAQLESEIMTSIGEPQPKPTGGETVIVEEVLKKKCQLESEIMTSVGESRPKLTGAETVIDQIEESKVAMQKILTEQIGESEIKNVDCCKYTNHSDYSTASMGEAWAIIPVSIIHAEQPTEETKLTIDSDFKLSKLESPGDSNKRLTEESKMIIEIDNKLEKVELPSQNDDDNIIVPLAKGREISPLRSVNIGTSLNLSIVPCNVSPVKSPLQSVSPQVDYSRKSLRTLTKMTASGTLHKDQGEFDSDVVNASFAKSFKSIASNAPDSQNSKNFHAPTEDLAASLNRGLKVIDSHRQSSSMRRSSMLFPLKPDDYKPMLVIDKVNVGVQTQPQDDEILEADSMLFLCSNCKCETPQQKIKKTNDNSDSQLVLADVPECADKLKKQVPKAVEKVLAGAIRREMALEEFCSKQTAEIVQLNRLVQQYRHERECNAIIGQMREDKIVRLECLMDGVLPTDEFIGEDLLSLKNEHKLLKEKYENHPELLTTTIELRRVQEELESYRNFHDLGEKEVLLEEIQDLRNQLKCYMDSSIMSARKQYAPPQFTNICIIQESSKESSSENFQQERLRWADSENKWISLTEELRNKLEASQSLAMKMKRELESEKKCAEELKEAMQIAMEGRARMLEQYADLQEKHITLLAMHRKMQEGIEDVKKAAAKAGVRGAESKFINALAGEISAIKVERERERKYWREENKGLQAQVRDTAEAVQAAGKLLVRLKEAEEAVAAAQNRAKVAAQETEKAHKQIAKLKNKHAKEINMLNQRLAESLAPKEVTRSSNYQDSNMRKDDAYTSQSDQQWKEEFAQLHNCEVGVAEYSSWFSGYDRCNI